MKNLEINTYDPDIYITIHYSHKKKLFYISIGNGPNKQNIFTNTVAWTTIAINHETFQTLHEATSTATKVIPFGLTLDTECENMKLMIYNAGTYEEKNGKSGNARLFIAIQKDNVFLGNRVHSIKFRDGLNFVMSKIFEKKTEEKFEEFKSISEIF